MKILQIEIFYQAYLDQFYARHPEIAEASCVDQTVALLSGGFSGGHNIVPYLAPLGYSPGYIIANCAQTQFAWLRENGLTASGDNLMHQIVRIQIEAIRPDILYFSDAIHFDSELIRSLSWRPPLVMGWHAAPLPDCHDWSEFDVILSGLSAMRAMALKLHAKSAAEFMPGIQDYVPALTDPILPTHDIVFAGSYTPQQHANRNRLLEAIARHAREKSYSCALYLTAPPPEGSDLMPYYRPPAFGNEMLQVLKTGRIVFDARSTMTGRADDGLVYDLAGNETSNMRIFETTGAGAFLLTEHFDNLAKFFVVGEEIESFTDETDLLAKIDHYLSHPEERDAIARRGQQRCLRNYSMAQRAREFDQIIRRYLPPA